MIVWECLERWLKSLKSGGRNTQVNLKDCNDRSAVQLIRTEVSESDRFVPAAGVYGSDKLDFVVPRAAGC